MAFLRRRDKRAREVRSGQRELIPARHVQLFDFLEPDEHDELLAFVGANEKALAPSTINPAGGGEKRRAKRVRRSSVLFEIEDVWPLFSDRLRGLMPTSAAICRSRGSASVASSASSRCTATATSSRPTPTAGHPRPMPGC